VVHSSQSQPQPQLRYQQSDSKISYRKVSAPRKWASAALLLESELFGARFFRLHGESSDRTVILRFHGLLDRKSPLEAGMVAPCRRAAIVPADEASISHTASREHEVAPC